MWGVGRAGFPSNLEHGDLLVPLPLRMENVETGKGTHFSQGQDSGRWRGGLQAGGKSVGEGAQPSQAAQVPPKARLRGSLGSDEGGHGSL